MDSPTKDTPQTVKIQEDESEPSFDHWLAKVWDRSIEPAYAKRHWEPIVERLTYPDKPQILVAGCATGAIIPALIRKMNPDEAGRVIALESQSPLLKIARSTVEEYDRNRVFLRGESMRKLKFAPGVFDIVISSLSWLRLPEPGVAIQEFLRVLKPEATVALSFPQSGSFQEIYDLFSEVTLKYDIPEVHKKIESLMKQSHPEQAEVRTLLEGVGFEGVEFKKREFELNFPSGSGLFSSDLIKALFEPGWREAAGDKADMLFENTREAIDTYFGTEAFQVRVIAGSAIATKPSAKLIIVQD